MRSRPHGLYLHLPFTAPKRGSQHFRQSVWLITREINEEVDMEKPFRAITLNFTRTPDAHQHSAILSSPTGEFLENVLQPAMLAVHFT